MWSLKISNRCHAKFMRSWVQVQSIRSLNIFIRLSSWLLMTQIKQLLLIVSTITSVYGAAQIKQTPEISCNSIIFFHNINSERCDFRSSEIVFYAFVRDHYFVQYGLYRSAFFIYSFISFSTYSLRKYMLLERFWVF